MKLVYLCNEYPPAPTGGIGTFTRGLARELVAKGHEVHVVGHYAQRRLTKDADMGVTIWRIPVPSGAFSPVTRRISTYRVLREISRSGMIDVLESPDFEGDSAFLPRCSRVVLVRLHGSHLYFADERGERASRLVSILEARALKSADAVLSVSNYTAQRTIELFGMKNDIAIVHNSVKVSESARQKTDFKAVRKIVYFGTLAEKKGVLSLAKAWKEFYSNNPGWSLSIIGRDTVHQGKSIHSLMVESMGEPAVAACEFCGPLPHNELISRLPGFDFAILPSYSEAFALAPMEAMAVGLPVIVSRMSSGPELIEDGVDGWLCDPRDFSSLVAAMDRAAASAESRKLVSRAAKHKIDTTFSYDTFLQKNLGMYSKIVRGEA